MVIDASMVGNEVNNIFLESDVAHDEGIVQITIPQASQDEPEFLPEMNKTIISFVFCFFSWVLTTVTLALVHERVPDRLNATRLPDIFLDNVPEYPWALIVSEAILVFSGLSCAVLVCFHKYRLILIRRIFFLLGVLYLFRCLTIYVTVLPVASKTYYCSPKANDATVWDVIIRALKSFIGMGLSITGMSTFCGDYIYSGHTVVLTLTCLIFQEYTPKRYWPLHWIAIMVSVSGVVFLMIAHGHYSVDVILAYYITTRLFWIYHTLANNPVLKEKGPNNYFSHIWWWHVFYYFEKNINCPLPRRYEWPISWAKKQTDGTDET